MTVIAKITNPERRQDWLVVFGTDEIKLKSPFPHVASLPGLDGPRLVYEADLTTLTADQRQRLITHIAGRFGVPVADVERDLDGAGLPILVDDVMITLWTHITPVRICDHCQDKAKEAFPYGTYDLRGKYWNILCNECFDALGCRYPDSDDDDWGYEGVICLTCGGTGVIITCVDDMCVGGNHCIHGDGEEICPECGGGY